MPAVSVIIPAYNAATTIAEALATVRGQTFTDTEIIIVDDASEDDTVKILEKSAADCRVIVHAQNQGPAGARNTGIEASTGEWVAFLDGDDAWLPHRLDAQLRLAARHPEVAVWCAGHVSFADDDPDKAAASNESFRLIPLEEFANHNPVATSTVLARRAALDAADGFDTSFRGPEDYDLWMRIAARHPIACMAAPLARYRFMTGSLSMDDRRFLPEVLRVLEKAFDSGGALEGHPELRRWAVANQYWNASWMAFNRGARLKAVQLWALSLVKGLAAPHRRPRPWLRLLARYLVGRRLRVS
jgi:glycosyltransferase involved in cell wall biosynthesis